MDYTVTYSNRKTIGIYVHKNGKVEVKCPFRTSNRDVFKLVEEKKEWIEKTIKKMDSFEERIVTDEERIAFIEKARCIIPERVKFYGQIMDVAPRCVKIGNAKSYWGCCSGKNSIIFSWRLMMASNEAIDYVVVHELAHIKEHNHSKRFWNEVYKIIPNYKVYVDELKKLK